jgi:hypothetical protein
MLRQSPGAPGGGEQLEGIPRDEQQPQPASDPAGAAERRGHVRQGHLLPHSRTSPITLGDEQSGVIQRLEPPSAVFGTSRAPPGNTSKRPS